MIIKKSFILIILFVLTSKLQSQPKSELTNTNFLAGINLNANFYFSNFRQLPDIPNCCNDFKHASGIGSGLFAGMELISSDNLRYNIQLSYNAFSADYKVRDFIGYNITGNTYQQTLVDHVLETKLHLLSIEPSLVYYPKYISPFSFKGGFLIGFPIAKSFNQDEELVNPQDITFENFKTIRNHQQGDIPKISPVYIALSVGSRYEDLYWGKFKIVPSIELNYGLNNIVKTLNWKVASAQAGIALHYRVPKTVILPPQPPVMPDMPLPQKPAPERLAFSFKIFENGRELLQNNNITVNVKSYSYINEFSLLPEIFFPPNSDNLNTVKMNKFDGIEAAQKNVVYYLKEYLKSNPEINIKINSVYLNDEDSTISGRRIQKIITYLEQNGISSTRIKFDSEQKNVSQYRYKELEDENRYIYFELSNGKKIIPVSVITDKKIEFSSPSVSIKDDFIADAKPYKYFNKIMLNDDLIFTENNTQYLSVNDSLFYKFYDKKKPVVLNFNGEISDARSQKIEYKIDKQINFNEIENNIFKNTISQPSYDSTQKISEFCLGFFNFDETEFYAVDSSALEQVKIAEKENKEIEIIPLTDNLGTKDYNSKLSRDRANAAMKLIGNYSKAKIIIPDKSFFSNSEPYTRKMNRSVIVRIK